MATGSSGNASIITGEHETIAIDFGLSYKKWSGLLDKNGHAFPSHLFITHGHSDHSNQSGLNRLMKTHPDILIHTNRGEFETEDFTLWGFLIPHNVPNHGYLVTEKATGERLVYVTDCSAMFDTLTAHADRLSGADTYALEANYDNAFMKHPEWLEQMGYRYDVFKNMARHTSKQEAIRTFAALKAPNSKLVTLHMSARFYNS